MFFSPDYWVNNNNNNNNELVELNRIVFTSETLGLFSVIAWKLCCYHFAVSLSLYVAE